MMDFYFHYDKDLGRAKVIVGEWLMEKETTHIVDDIICDVPTRTEHRDGSPKFVVCGTCSVIAKSKTIDGNEIIHIS